MKKSGIISVARLAGVSPSTVSRAMNHPELVHPATQKKIDMAMRRSGYIRNRSAQAMHGKRSGTIGLIVPTVNHAIFAEVVQSFGDAVSQAGFVVLLASHGYNLSTEYQLIRKLLEHRVDGVALTGLNHRSDSFHLLREQEVPALALWNYAPASAIPCVGADNGEAGRKAAEHLLLLGHRRIATAFPPVDENDRAAARREAALAALRAGGAEIRDKWAIVSPYSLSQSKEACLALLGQQDRPTALLCGNDVIAHGALHAARKLGIAVPQELSVIGIGDFPGSAEIEPGLTTVRIPARRIGETAGRLFVDAIAANDPQSIYRRKFDIELVMRDSTAPV